MGMFGKILESIGSQWRMCKEDTRMMLCGGFVKEERELQAMKNLIQVAKERVWLTDPSRAHDYTATFSDELDENEKTIIMDSAAVVEDLLGRETELRRKHVR